MHVLKAIHCAVSIPSSVLSLAYINQRWQHYFFYSFLSFQNLTSAQLQKLIHSYVYVYVHLST